MTIRDVEVLEALRDQPELLALADAVAETQRLTRRSRRRAVSRSAALVAIGLAALLIAFLWPGSGGGRNIVLDRALAAIGNGPILHLVTRAPIGERLVNVRTGRMTVPMYELESWSDRSAKRFHMIERVDGKVVGEALFPQDGGGVSFGPVDPGYAALWSGYCEALASGKAKIVRREALYGHPVYWLMFPTSHTEPGSLVAIDRRNYRPVAFRFDLGGGRHVDYRVLLARTEALSPSAFRRQTHRPSPFGGATSSGGGGIEESNTVKLTKPWLGAGTTVAGLRLASVRSARETSGPRSARGVALTYGHEAALPIHAITIRELEHPVELPSDWKGIPRGFIRIQPGETSAGSGRSHTLWTGYLVVHGIYVTIETGVSRAAVLEAARALRPV
jgi:hypothetical protein